MDVTRSAGPPERSQGHIWRLADCEFDERRRELRVRGQSHPPTGTTALIVVVDPAPLADDAPEVCELVT
jgi:hypothetical protein